MLLAGDQAARLMREYGVKGATDVTGFSLIGHAWEMAEASSVTIEIASSAVPLVSGALGLAAEGLMTGGDKTNRQYVAERAFIAGSVSTELGRLLFDPQTAGGMLIAIDSDRSDALLAALRHHYPEAAIIGRATEPQQHSIVVT